MSDRKIALSARNVWKVFGPHPDRFSKLPADQRTDDTLKRDGLVGAVQDATFDIAHGEVFVIMGLSGSGKSTLLRCLTRLIEPTLGEVQYDGQNILTMDDKQLVQLRRARMGMVFQHFALLPNRTVLGNIAFPLEVQGVARSEALARAHELLEKVGLSGRETRFPSELSGGQQQRVGIARSLATDPEFWFLDEPFSALDPLIRADLQTEVLRLQTTQSRTVVFVTHDLDEAIRLADRIAIMEGGRIVQIGTPEDLVTSPASDYVRRFVAKVPAGRVIRVSSLMDRTAGAASHGLNADATLSEIGPELLAGQEILPVMNADGRQIGILNRQLALETLLRQT